MANRRKSRSVSTDPNRPSAGSARVKAPLEVSITTWPELVSLAGALRQRYAFRGQAGASWPLASSLERAIVRFDPLLGVAINREHWMLHSFKRRYHLYSRTQPPEADNVEWLALMQHHGAPTRLLDFTE